MQFRTSSLFFASAEARIAANAFSSYLTFVQLLKVFLQNPFRLFFGEDA
jgi:hypothetical protein